MTDRSSLREVRNPILALPAAQRLQAELSPLQRAALRGILKELKVQCRQNEAEAYKRRKGPMTAYWMAAGTYAGHLAQALK